MSIDYDVPIGSHYAHLDCQHSQVSIDILHDDLLRHIRNWLGIGSDHKLMYILRYPKHPVGMRLLDGNQYHWYNLESMVSHITRGLDSTRRCSCNDTLDSNWHPIGILHLIRMQSINMDLRTLLVHLNSPCKLGQLDNLQCYRMHLGL